MAGASAPPKPFPPPLGRIGSFLSRDGMDETSETQSCGALCQLRPKKEWKGKRLWKAPLPFSKSNKGNKPAQVVFRLRDLM